MKVRINQQACAGHARCNHVAPGLYSLDDNGYIASTGFTIEAGQQPLALRGARACPERIIEVIDEPASAPSGAA